MKEPSHHIKSIKAWSNYFENPKRCNHRIGWYARGNHLKCVSCNAILE